jgi:hypothetical protein
MVPMPLVQQIQQRPASTQPGVEEGNFFVEGAPSSRIAEIAMLQRTIASLVASQSAENAAALAYFNV